MITAQTLGLTTAAGLPVSLVGVRMEATLTGPVAEVAITHSYVNSEAIPIEAVYIFPLPEGAALSGVSALVDGRVIEGSVKERSDAFASYDDAMADGHGAFLIDQERDDVFRISVGNLNPGKSVEITMRYALLVGREGPALRLQLPTVVPPRYVPASGIVGVVGETDDERLNPERRAHVPYGLTLAVNAILPGGITALESPSHPIRVEHRPDGALVSLSRQGAPLDRDLVLLIEPRQKNQPFGAVGLDAQGRRHVLVNFEPDVESFRGAAGAPIEALFLLDCSGSMEGDSITQARRALALSIRTLQPGDTFDIVRFGSTFDAMWGKSREFTEATLTDASAWLAKVGADLGGTEIAPALASLLSRPASSSHARQVILLTDGQVSNDDEVIALARGYASTARIFSFGIGGGVGEALVRGVARVSRGAAELIGSGERIEPKVLRQFGRLREPALTDVRVDFGSATVTLSPAAIPPVFSGDRLAIFGRLDAGAPTSAALRVSLPGGREMAWSVPIDFERPTATSAIATLWAKAKLRELLDGQGRRTGSAQSKRARERDARPVDPALALALDYQLAYEGASWVLVEVRQDADKTIISPQLRPVPVEDELANPAFLRSGGPASRATLARFGLAPSSALRAQPTGAPVPPPPASPPWMAAPAGAMPLPAPKRAAPESTRQKGAGGPLKRAMAKLFSRDTSDSESMSMPPNYDAAPSAAPSGGAVGGGYGGPSGSRQREEAVDDLLYDVLMLQRADGSFADGPALRKALGLAMERLEAAGGGAYRLTQAVLYWLASVHGARRAEWQGAADKARTVLLGHLAATDAEVAAWFKS
ncbi:MAG: VWA domain-containing protein [Myxococcales bacterium]|nr:VWA domain-containing protein [Myxococcales bacterium]